MRISRPARPASVFASRPSDQPRDGLRDSPSAAAFAHARASDRTHPRPAFGIVERNRFRAVEVDLPIRNLPADLAGLRIVQITDIHLSAFLSEKEFARAVDMANEARANLALVTGDLISRRGDPVDACLRQLARLRADAGVLGCLGNHEIYTGTEEYVAREGRRIGIDFLRTEARLVRFGSATVYVFQTCLPVAPSSAIRLPRKRQHS